MALYAYEYLSCGARQVLYEFTDSIDHNFTKV